ncbi:MAG: hypothetical protein JO208_04140 [Alphaproteobacteria bacterium]|nr:hypothetical protein [Alphaproteobacteria bacterium]
MDNTRREVFRASILSGLGAVGLISLAKADVSSTQYVLVRADNNKNLLLKIRGFKIIKVWLMDAKPHGPAVPTGTFDLEDAVQNGTYSLSPMQNTTFTLGGMPIAVDPNGTINGSEGAKLPSPPAWNEIGAKHDKCGKGTTPGHESR